MWNDNDDENEIIMDEQWVCNMQYEWIDRVDIKSYIKIYSSINIEYEVWIICWISLRNFRSNKIIVVRSTNVM